MLGTLNSTHASLPSRLIATPPLLQTPIQVSGGRGGLSVVTCHPSLTTLLDRTGAAYESEGDMPVGLAMAAWNSKVMTCPRLRSQSRTTIPERRVDVSREFLPLGTQLLLVE